VTPPEVPRGILFAETIETGWPPARVPTSVAQVSAADAANAPTPVAYQIGDGTTRCPSADIAKTPPLARTCRAFRSLPCWSNGRTSSAFLLSPNFESALAVTKNESSSTPQLQPVVIASVATIVAATAPLVDSVRVRRATMLMKIARTPPAMACVRISLSCDDLVIPEEPQGSDSLLEGDSSGG
jgi:hypothetical protein